VLPFLGLEFIFVMRLCSVAAGDICPGGEFIDESDVAVLVR
jgi:hypothetical protein